MKQDIPARVAVVACDRYAVDEIERAVIRAVSELGGIDALLEASTSPENSRRDGAPDDDPPLRAETADKNQTGEDATRSPADHTPPTVLLKPNLLASESPGSCAVTHHAVFEAVGRVLSAPGRRLVYGDSPAIHSTAAAAKACGIRDAADRLGIEELSFRDAERTVSTENRQNKVLPIATVCLSSDHIVNVAKLKTHGFMTLTGAVKNMFGCVSGLEKARFHAKLEDPNQFARMVVDLHRSLSPRLSIIDAIEAMEGNGPRNGTAFHIGAIIVSTDPVAADVVGAQLLGIDPNDVPTIVEGHRAGLGTMTDFELVGDPLPVPDRAAVPARGKADLTILPKILKAVLRKLWVLSPVIDKKKCIQCFECLRICPTDPKSIVITGDRYPSHKYDSCIRCYCCQETCPANAISIRHKLLA